MRTTVRSPGRAPRLLRHPAHRRGPPRQLPRGGPALGRRTSTTHDAIYCVVDLHALTVPQDPAELRAKTLELMALLVAAGLDPEVCTLFVQSHVPEHAAAGAGSWSARRRFGELQPHDPVQGEGRAGRVHLGRRCSPTRRSGGRHPPVRHRPGARGRRPAPAPRARPGRRRCASTAATATRSSCPSTPSPRSAPGSWTSRTRRGRCRSRSTRPRARCSCSTRPTSIDARRSSGPSPTPTARCATTPRPSPASPTCSSILGAVTGGEPEALADRYDQYGPLKADTAEAVVEVLRPLQERFAELAADPAEVDRVIGRRRREGPGHRRPVTLRPSAMARRSGLAAPLSAPSVVVGGLEGVADRRAAASTASAWQVVLAGPGDGERVAARPARAASAPIASWRR